MDNKPDQTNRTLILYFVLSIFFAALSMLASRVITVKYFRSYATITINMKWMFWLSAALSVAFILPLIRSILFTLHQQGRLPKAMGWFFRDEVSEKVVSIIHSIQSFVVSTLGRLMLAGLGIFLLTYAVWRSGVIHEMETDSNLLTLADAARGRHPDIAEASYSTVELSSYIHTQRGSYIRDCLRLVRDLKAGGAKVVVLGTSAPIVSKDEFVLLRKLEETGIVVFATEYWRTLRVADSTGELKLSAGSVTMPENEVDETSYRLVRLRPTGIDNVGSPRLLDISMEILRKYKGYGNDVAWTEEGGEFRFGEFRVPVTSDGWMYSKSRGFRIWDPLVYVDSTGAWEYESGGEKFYSSGIKKAGLKIEGHIRNGKNIPAQDIGTLYQGKIVLLTDSFGRSGSYLVSQAYESAVENILTGDLIRKWEMGHLWLSVLCLVLAGFIAYRVRLVVAILILLAMLPCVLLFGSYLYTSYNVLVDLFYPLLSTAMAVVIFPVIV
ncbi:MAG TPA: hypothetical protein VMH23_20035, partial [Bacteroidota bacterium]|nr:hypothetical protein [Bacteroidota bacterium]